jgi:ABC-type transport system involved in multi-copper enzyme maturation permease subunit
MEMTVNQRGIKQKIKLKCLNAVDTFVIYMIRGLQNEIIYQIFIFLFSIIITAVILYLIGFVLFVVSPSPTALIYMAVSLAIFFIFAFIAMITILFDRILAVSKSRNLANKINSIIITELESSKFNPKRIEGVENAGR